MAGADRILRFGESEGCDIQLCRQTRSSLGQTLLIKAFGQQLELELGMQAPHWGVNALAVLGVAAALELDLHAAARHLSGMADLPGRGARFDLVIEGIIAGLLMMPIMPGQLPCRRRWLILPACRPRGGC